MRQDDFIEEIPLKNNHVLRIYRDDDAGNPRTEWDNFGHIACWHNKYNLGDSSGKGSRNFNPIHSDVEDMFSHITGMSPDDEEFQEQTDEEGNVIKEETSYDDAMEIIGEKALELAVILPLSLYDHGGITMSVGRHSGWDYSNVGYIYATLEEGRKNWTVDENDTVEAWYGPNKGKRVPLRECIERVLRSEVEVYDQYLTGDVYGFRVLKKVTTTWVDKNDPTKEVSETELEETDSCWGFYGDNWMINGIADHVPDELFTLDQLEGIKEALKKELQES